MEGNIEEMKLNKAFNNDKSFAEIENV